MPRVCIDWQDTAPYSRGVVDATRNSKGFGAAILKPSRAAIYECAEWLIKRGADPNEKASDDAPEVVCGAVCMINKKS